MTKALNRLRLAEGENDQSTARHVCLLLIIAIPVFSAEKDLQVVAGAGPSTRVVELFFKGFNKTELTGGYNFSIPLKSSKPSGGIENSNRFLFGRTGRPLNPDELAKNKGEIFLARVPIEFVAGAGVNIHSLSLE